MERKEIFEKLNRVFQTVFDRPDLTVSDGTSAKDVDGWDSLMHITLIAVLEDTFDMKFRMAEVKGMKTVGEMVDVIHRETS